MSNKSNAGQKELLYARLDDLSELCARGELGISPFLSPGELYFAETYLRRKGAPYIMYGGISDAERRRVYLLPDYMEELSDAETSDIENRFAEFGYFSNISALRIKGSGYRKLTHRDFLGSVLGLGLERSVVGDIFVMGDGESEAIMLCDSAIADFLLNELSHIANDKVRVSSVRHGEWEAPKRRMQEIHDTVASPRLDAVVAALCNLSRENASSAVLTGLVELNFENEERPDRTVAAPSIISVRGIGRFRVLSLSDKTRKGRYRLDAEKYV